MNFSLTQLEYVMAVHKTRHFARAADVCHVSQPTLSMQIQKLEEELGGAIFDRTKKPILLTDLGSTLIEQFQEVLLAARRIPQLVNQKNAHKNEGELSVGVIPTVTPYLLPLLLPTMEKQFPRLKLKLFEWQTSKIIESLGADELDVGILATPLKDPKIYEFALYYETFSVLCHRGHELEKQRRAKYNALKGDDIWLLEEGHCMRNQVLDVCSMKKNSGQSRQFTFESGNLETLKNLVDTYGGYTLLPSLATKSIGKNCSLIPFERPIPAREIGLVYRREHYKNDLIEALGEAILKSIPEEVRKIRPKDLDVLPI